MAETTRRGPKITFASDGTRAEVLNPREKETIIREKDQWNDQLEAIKFTTEVFTKLDDMVGSDFVLAKLSEPQKDFIIENVKQAFCLRRQVQPHDKEISERMFKTVIAESIMLVILNRNVEKNVLLEIIGGIHKKEEEPEMEVPDSLWTKMKKKIPGMGGGEA